MKTMHALERLTGRDYRRELYDELREQGMSKKEIREGGYLDYDIPSIIYMLDLFEDAEDDDS